MYYEKEQHVGPMEKPMLFLSHTRQVLLSVGQCYKLLKCIRYSVMSYIQSLPLALPRLYKLTGESIVFEHSML
jgi:hypothetical protein